MFPSVFSVVWNSFFLPTKSQLLLQIITWTGYTDSTRGADNGHCHGLSAREGNARVSPYCDTGHLGLKPFQATENGLRAQTEMTTPFAQTENSNYSTKRFTCQILHLKHLNHRTKYLHCSLRPTAIQLKKYMSILFDKKNVILCDLC